MRWELLSRPHPVIRLEDPDVLAVLNHLAGLLSGYDEDCVAEGRLVSPGGNRPGAGLAVLYEAKAGRLTAVATDPFGSTVWWRGTPPAQTDEEAGKGGSGDVL